MDVEHAQIGPRVREIRNWRGMNLSATAGLAGLSVSYLSMIERGQRPVTRHAILEALALALRVSPEELTGQPYMPADPLSNEAHAGIAAIEAALDAYDLSTDPGVSPRPWPELGQAVQDLNEVLRADADYAALGGVIPGLLAELHATYVREPDHRRDVLVGLVYTYRAAAGVTKCLGVRGLPLVAARLAQTCAEELESPEWLGFGSFVRGYAAGSLDRPHQYNLAVRTIDMLQPALDDASVVQAAGALHLNAALVKAAQGEADRASDHVAEATELANRLPEHTDNFGWLHFSAEAAGIWRVSLGAELGEGAKVAEYARTVRPEAIEGRARRAAFLKDIGCALVTEKRMWEKGVQTLSEAERTAPQLIRNNPFVRDVVSAQLRRARRDAGGRELRGLAWRMGIAPTG
ncbi:helix-turn-helix domain-containing protein [Actinophytocola sp.]|uniref:helix-turn-helix domain-containing protein n=1 Tax=Actinophytocola sp. TaxID=1872138 RepID=UPI002ED3A1EC